MIPAVKSELRKLVTTRTNYIFIGLAVLMVLIFAFWGEGIKGGASVGNPGKLANEVANAIGVVSFFGAIVSLLLVTQEYRYNTIAYTLTAARRRTHVFLAKIIAVTIFSLLFSLFIGALSPILAYVGLKIGGFTLSPQNFPFWDLLWRGLFVGWAYSMYSLIISFIIRAQVGAFVALFLTRATVEPLLGIVLKSKAIYLPFSALGQVLNSGDPGESRLSYTKAAIVTLIYILIGWLVAWQLFLRRDAN